MSARFEYGGIETALSGLTQWVQDKVKSLKGNAHDRYQAACKIIVDYGVANVPGFIKKGHASVMAEYVAKKVHKNNKFNHFAKWVLENKVSGVIGKPCDINHKN